MDEQVIPVGSHHCNVVPVGVAVSKDSILVGFDLLVFFLNIKFFRVIFILICFFYVKFIK